MGTVLVRAALEKIRRGLDGVLSFEEVEKLGEQVVETSLCGLGQTCGIAQLGAVRTFRARLETEVAPHRPIPAQHGMTCVTAPCIEACPSKVNVPRYIDYGQQLGRDVDIEDLFQRGYKAVFLGLGCQAGLRLGVEGEDAAWRGYHSGIDFLLKVHDHVDGTAPLSVDGEVFVVGGGNVAMDCALCDPAGCRQGPCHLSPKAARNIEDWVERGSVRFFKRSRMRKLLAENRFLGSDVAETPVRNEYRARNPELDPELRKHMFEEVEQTISDADAYAQRCMRCYRIYRLTCSPVCPHSKRESVPGLVLS